MTATRSFSYDGTTYTVRAKRTNRSRDEMVQLYNRLRDAGVPDDKASTFASIVIYTVAVEGDGWQPPAVADPDGTLREAYRAWYDDGDADLTDAFLAAIYPAAAVATGPAPLPEDADPN